MRAQRFYAVRGEDRTILGEWLPGVRYLEVKMYMKARWGREVSAVRSLEVVASRR